MFAQLLCLFTAFLATVLALPLAKRDVVDPPVTSPTASTVWHVGQKQLVTWNATGLPTQQSNPVGKLVLGFLFNNSENLMLDSPLATNLNYTVGQAEITVPNVPTRSDYIVVLFGDSGNASPEFTIINDATSSTSVVPPASTETSPSAPGSSPPAASTPPSTPSPASPNSPGSSGGGSSPTPVNGSSASKVAGALPTPTAPSSGASGTSRSSTTVTLAASSTATTSTTNSSAAWQKQVPSLGTSLSVVLAVVYLAFS